MNNLISMQRPKPDKEETKPMTVDDEYYEKFPYGLRISLNDEDMQKLGMSSSGFNVEDIMLLKAKVLITNVSSEQNMNSNGVVKVRDRMELQITDLSLVSDTDFDVAFDEAIDEQLKRTY